MKSKKRRPHNRICKSTVALPEGAAPPTEFRIWKYGRNTDTNGFNVLFDEKTAAQLMASYKQHAIDCMIDLEHLSLDQESQNFDPDARGWCALEVRKDAAGKPELWATNVRWTPDGQARLENKTQRYVSPTWFSDEDGRPTRLVNIALTAIPATDAIQSLVAAKETLMAAEEAGVTAGVDNLAAAELFGVDIDPGADPAGFIKALEEAVSKFLTKLRGGEAPPAEEPAGEPAPPSEEAAAAREVIRLCGARSLVASIATLSDWRKLAIEHASASQKLEADKKALEATRLRAMTARLVVAGAELPGTAWEDDAHTIPAAHLRGQSLEQLEKRAQAFEARSGTRGPLRAAQTSNGLSDAEVAKCKAKGIDPEKYAATKAAIKARSGVARAEGTEA